MNRIQACELLGVSTTATEDEINSAFRKLAAKAHPDVNKDPNAEENFKKLNEAYQFLKNPQPDPRGIPIDFNNDIDILNMFINMNKGGFGRSSWSTHYYNHTDIPSTPPAIANVVLNFTEGVLGCSKDVTYTANIKCVDCNGSKYIDGPDTKKCDECDGKGFRFYGVGTANVSDRELPCRKCKGKGNTATKISCPNCKATGFTQQFDSMKVNFPAGLSNVGNLSVRNNKTSLNIQFKVQPDPDMQLIGADVVSDLELTLLEALEGGTKSVRTVKGEKQLKIKPGVKNAEVIKVNGFGVPNRGNHLFQVSIKYPENTQKLIEFLRETDVKENNKE